VVDLIAGRERALAGIAFTSILAGIAEAGILAVVAQVGASLISGAGSVAIDAGPLHVEPTIDALLILAAVLAVARIALQGATSLQQARLVSDVQSGLRDGLFGAFTRASWGMQSADREGHLQEMLTSQVVQTTAGTVQFASLVSSGLTFLVLVLSALVLNIAAAALIVVIATALFFALRPLSSLGRRNAKELSQAQLNFAQGVGEAVRVSEETHVFGVGAAQAARMSALVDVSRGLFFRTQFVTRFIPTLFQSLIYLVVIGGLALVYETGVGNVGSLGAVVLLMVRAGSYGQQVQASYQAMLQALPFAERLRQATGRYKENAVVVHDRRLPEISQISFSDVSFSYRPDQPVLSGIDFEIARGQAVGVVGPSGAGKSTLVQLLLRLRQPDTGTYAVNGLPAQEFAAADWHRQVAYVPQEPKLIHASVAENIRYFREIDDAMVERAARLARIDEDIHSWSDGYETTIGPRADSISGGQRQRICLARALAADPDVLVLDEPTSALDPRSELLIQQSLTDIAAELTLFVVTHRMTMLAVCDSVLVIVGGRVDDFGRTHVVRETNSYLSAA